MRREFLQHRVAYLVLVLGLVMLTLLFMATWPNHWWQRGVIVVLSAFYASWGITTHVHADKITRKIALEYISMAVLAGVILFLVTL